MKSTLILLLALANSAFCVTINVSNYQTLAALQQQISLNSDDIEGIFWPNVDDIEGRYYLSSPITINNNDHEIILRSTAGCQLSGNNVVRIVKIINSDFVRISGLKFEEGFAMGLGGSTYVENVAECIFESVNFIENRAIYDPTQSRSMGGAVYCYNSAIEFNNCNFSSNSCGDNYFGIITSDALSFGGAISAVNSRVVINSLNSDGFINNYSYIGEGGALYLHNSSFSIINADFHNNSSCFNGGAIKIAADDYEWMSPGFVGEIIGCSYLENSVVYCGTQNEFLTFGGAIACGDWVPSLYGYEDNLITINSCTFIDNTAECGGAISCSDTIIELGEDDSFAENEAKNGGAIYSNGGVRIIGGSYINNTARYRGGAIFCNNNHCITSIAESIFANNSALQGGAICVVNAVLTVNDSRFDSNVASDIGGAIAAPFWKEDMIQLDLVGCEFNDCAVINMTVNNAFCKGGAISASGQTNVENCIFYNCFIYSIHRARGGVIHCKTIDGFNNHLKIYNTLMQNCYIDPQDNYENDNMQSDIISMEDDLDNTHEEDVDLIIHNATFQDCGLASSYSLSSIHVDDTMEIVDITNCIFNNVLRPVHLHSDGASIDEIVRSVWYPEVDWYEGLWYDLQYVDPKLTEDGQIKHDSPCFDSGIACHGDPGALITSDFDLTPVNIGWSPAYPITELAGTVSSPLPAGHYLVTDDATVATPLAPGTVLKVVTGKSLILVPGPDHVVRLGDTDGSRTAIVGRPEAGVESAAAIQILADGHPDSRLEAEGVLFNYPASNGTFHGIQFNDLFHQALDMNLNRNLVEFRNYVNVRVSNETEARIDGRLLLENCRGRVAGFEVGNGDGGPAQVNLLFSNVDVEDCSFQITGTSGAPILPPLTMVGLQGSGTPKLQDNLFTVDVNQSVPLTEFSLTTADMERNSYLECRSTAIIETHSALYMDHEARNDLRAHLSLFQEGDPIIEMEGGDLDLFCGRNNFIVRGYEAPDWPIIRWTGDTHAAQVWRENFWGTGCANFIPEEDVDENTPAWATVEASLAQCLDSWSLDNPLCPFEPLTPYELLKNGLLAEAAEDYPLAQGNWHALLVLHATSKYAGEGTLRLKALGFVPTYGPTAYEDIRDDLFAGALASQLADMYQQKILQICAAWCVEARWGDRPGAVAALNLLLANEQDKICRDTITLALLEISLYPPQGGFSAAGPGVQTGRLLARQQAVQELLDFRRDGARTIRAAEEEGARPGGLCILGAWPNPFNPVTMVEFSLSGEGPTRLGLYNLLGQLVAEPLRQPLSAGLHRVRVDGGSLSSGVYLAVLEQGGQHQVHKLLLVK